MRKLLLGALFVAGCLTATAQVETPQPSPESTIQQKVGLTDFTVNYSRPSVKGREVFGGLVPYGEIWRTGANGSTDIEFTTDIKFNGKEVKAGKYSIYTVPNKDAWKVMLYKNTELWGAPGDKFNQEDVAVETTVKPRKNSAVESFTIGFDHLRNNSAHLTMAWDDVLVAVPVEVDARTLVDKSIEKTLAGPGANDYFNAAKYYFEEDLDLDKAHKWVSKAIELRPDAFWMMKVKSEIEAKQGKYKTALKTARASLKLAEKAKYKPYIKMNKENIAKWLKKK